MEESAISVCAKQRRFVQSISKLADSSRTTVYGNNVVQSGNKIGNKSLQLQMTILCDVDDTAHSVG